MVISRPIFLVNKVQHFFYRVKLGSPSTRVLELSLKEKGPLLALNCGAAEITQPIKSMSTFMDHLTQYVLGTATDKDLLSVVESLRRGARSAFEIPRNLK